MGRNQPGESGVKLLADLLKDKECNVEILKLFDCSIAENGCVSLLSALKLNPSHLRELDLGWNKPGEAGVKMLSNFLEDSNCKLEILKLHDTNITDEGYVALASALISNPLHLRELDLSWNEPGKIGVDLLSSLVEDKNSALKKLEICDLSLKFS
ncbi:ribonuclease inhibitor-like [Astyanax mexicanus]|uniref:ribonuclease inhibitor-like n=1 Tax=Astyanax mexicanus TaxID=7994 RepID=UPI0020CAB6D3|nr:ribonuclease inhibitor-like [Astyanax mexicanus]